MNMHAMFVAGILAFWGIGLVLAVPLPSVPSTYHTIVSGNIAEKGYTVAWEEWYDSSKQLLRADGRFSDTRYTQIVDYRNQTMTIYARDNSSEPCLIYDTSKREGSFFTFPVTHFFADFNQTNMTYFGNGISPRGIQSDIYLSTLPPFTYQDGDNLMTMYITTTQYWSSNVTGLGQVPISIQLGGYKSTTMNGTLISNITYAHYYSFLEWSQQPISPSIFNVPTGCSAAPAGQTPPSTLRQKFTNQVVPQPQLGSIPLPQIPNTFTTFVEIKSNSAIINPSVSTPKWSFSYAINPLERSERLDVQDQSTGQTTVIYNFNVTSANNYGTITSRQNGTCSNAVIPAFTSSPLSSYRAGFVPELFANSGSFGAATYQGRFTIRGVPADMWSIPATRTIGNTVYTFTSQMYFFPQGWQFPGRQFSSSLEPPLRVTNNGSYSFNGGAPVSYSDSWDFHFFQTSIYDANTFNAAQLCPNLAPLTPVPTTAQMSGGGSSSNGGAIAAAVIFALLFAAAVGFIVYRWYAQKHSSSEQFRRHDDSGNTEFGQS